MSRTRVGRTDVRGRRLQGLHSLHSEVFGASVALVIEPQAIHSHPQMRPNYGSLKGCQSSGLFELARMQEIWSLVFELQIQSCHGMFRVYMPLQLETTLFC